MNSRLKTDLKFLGLIILGCIVLALFAALFYGDVPLGVYFTEQ